MAQDGEPARPSSAPAISTTCRCPSFDTLPPCLLGDAQRAASDSARRSRHPGPGSVGSAGLSREAGRGPAPAAPPRCCRDGHQSQPSAAGRALADSRARGKRALRRGRQPGSGSGAGARSAPALAGAPRMRRLGSPLGARVPWIYRASSWFSACGQRLSVGAGVRYVPLLLTSPSHM
jgi:hypothetical protein